MKEKKDLTQDKDYQKYVNSNDRKRSSGLIKQLRKSLLSDYQILANNLLTNGGNAPVPNYLPNGRQKAKLASQTR